MKDKKRGTLPSVVASQPALKRTRDSGSLQTHTVCVPDGYLAPTLDNDLHGTIEDPRWAGELVKTYPFDLDGFQQTAIACIERNESVLVAAHTSAGKTAVAEYAIAKALKNRQRVVYTSPLKALSNQKYRDLSQEFTDVGLMTGDVTLNENAACIVMTTEILRSMMYRGSEMMREVSWVIFDEVHYMQDRERGVVWEEVIIFMPQQARMLFLSATLSNAPEFASWVACVHGNPCHVVYTDYRPTPLVHYGFPAGGKGLYLLHDGKAGFRSANFAALKEATGAEMAAIGNNKGQPDDKQSDMRKLARLLKEREWSPVIFFSFSRRDCENYAGFLASPDSMIDFNTPKEASEVKQIFENALACLSPEDRQLSMINRMLPMLQRGIGVHHSGLLPILKELVEILFQEQLVKCLFSTETFAMGLNMPAKTVVFTAIRKFDGQEYRCIGSGEYVQMSGRAGRRGKDDRGFALIMIDDQIDESVCKEMLCGSGAPLLSSFKLTYYTLLNLVRRVEGTGFDMEYVINKSFSQFQHNRELPRLEKKLKEIESEASLIEGVSIEAVEDFTKLQADLKKAEQDLRVALLKPSYCIHFLRPGRIIRVVHGGIDWGYGVVISVIKNEPLVRNSENGKSSSSHSYLLDTMLCCSSQSAASGRVAPAGLNDENAQFEVVTVDFSGVAGLCSLRISLPNDLTHPDSRKAGTLPFVLVAVLLTLRELVKQHGNAGLPELDPVVDMGIKDEIVLKAIKKVSAMKTKVENNAVYQVKNALGENEQNILTRRVTLLENAQTIKKKMRESQLTSYKIEARQRMEVLQKLGHLDKEGLLTAKGRAACEIDTADELLTAELMFKGTFASLHPAHLAALASCLVPVDKSQSEIKLSKELAEALTELQESAIAIAGVQLECKLDVDPTTYAESFRASLMDVVYAWCTGASFEVICGMTDIFEGSIIRAMRRLDELLHNLELAATAIGEKQLATLFNESYVLLQRGLPFAASLYV